MVRYQSTVSLNCSVFFLMVGVGLIVSLLPGRMVSLSGSFSDVGGLASFFALPFVLLQVPVGILADRYGYKGFLVSGYLTCGLAAMVYCVAGTPSMLFLGRFVQGVGEVPVWALVPAVLSIEWPEDRGKAMGMYNASIHLGLTVGSLLGLLGVVGNAGNGPFMVFAVTGLLGGALVKLFAVESPAAGSAAAGGLNLKTAGALMISRKCRPVFAGIALYGCGYGVLLTVIPIFLVGPGVNGQHAVSLFFVLFYVAISLSQLMGGAFSDKTGRVKTMLFGLCMASAGFLVALTCQGPLLLSALALASFGLGVFCVSAMASLSESVPASLRGTVSGAFYLAWGIGFFIGPVLLGICADRGCFDLGLSLFSLILLGNALRLAFPYVSKVLLRNES